ncbi:hypothetical protein QCA50_007456 [Cerrena zonata]|uniref:Uncharacterized protein n=1 Tax=Cerrena zonata TaxID=2478898 RepID=A0AAW0G8J4_9APHY
MTFEYSIPQSEIALTRQGFQSLLDNCGSHLKEYYFEAKMMEVYDFKDTLSVSLARNPSLTDLGFRVSNLCFKYVLEQLQTVSLKGITLITFFYWLDEKEKPESGLWEKLDDILNMATFTSLVEIKNEIAILIYK